MCRAAQGKELRPEPSRHTVALNPAVTLPSAQEQSQGWWQWLCWHWPVMPCKEADCAVNYMVWPSLCLYGSNFRGFRQAVAWLHGLNTPTSSWSPFGALLDCLCPFAFRQSNPLCTGETMLQHNQNWVSGDNGEISFKSDSWAEPTHCHRLTHNSVVNIGLEGRTEHSVQNILDQVFFSFVHLWVHKDIASGGEGLVTANASLLTKGLFFLCTFCRLFRSHSLPKTSPAKNHRFKYFGPDLWAAKLCSVWWK